MEAREEIEKSLDWIQAIPRYFRKVETPARQVRVDDANEMVDYE